MNSITDATVIIQTSPEAVPAPPPWLGEVVLLIRHLDKQGILDAISEQVRFARRRFGRYEVIDFVAVLFGYAISGERTKDLLLRAPTSLRRYLHGALWTGALACPLDALALFGGSDPGAGRSPAHPVSR